MATKLPELPPPPDPSVARFDADGKPTPAQVTYERKLQQYLKALGVALTTTG